MMKTLNKVKRRLRKAFGQRSPLDTPMRSSLQSSFRDSQHAIIVHGLHKSASMFLFKFFHHLSAQIDVPFHSIHLPPPDRDPPAADVKSSFIYGPERSFQTQPFQYRHVKPVHLFQVRDPRDILVSEYFSLGWRHSDQHWDDAAKARRQKIQQLTIDQYVIAEPELSPLSLRSRYGPLLDPDPSTITGPEIVKYETMVNDFPQWLQQVLPLVGLDSPSHVRVLADHYKDEFTPDLQTNAHKRNVSSGDHVTKLQPATLSILNQRFAPVLDALGYDR